MNANELRIGNWLIAVEDEYGGKKFQIDSGDINEIAHPKYGYKYGPIPLSPEILEKCGFVLNRNNELSIEINDIASHLELMSGAGGFYYPSFTQTPQGDEERTVYFNRINSLHQLQNLYFSLCGEELTYKQ
jgi:hypothetical protein